ncbi:MAG TPA: hypothetical protein VG318_04220 [Actinomycetota bacterium]|nr:hypothetical protein [Actinomycetota bacterium]
MSRFEVAPEELRATGAALKTVAPGVEAAAADLGTVAGTVGEPRATAAALDEMAAHWFAGLQRLAQDVVVFGGLTQLAANGYEVVDTAAMPAVVTEDDPPVSPFTPGGTPLGAAFPGGR